MAYIGQDPVIGRYILVDQISGGFNGTASGFTLAAGGQGVIPGLAQNVLLSLGGVIQQPGTDYTVSGSGITFTTPPLSGTTFFATVLGDVQAVGTPSDGTVLPASIATSGTFVFPNITTTGTTLIASGNASTPSLAVIGDTNTGLYSPGADQLAISTGGTGRLFIDATGLVGIGTTAPGTALHVAASTSGNPLLRLTDNSGVGGGGRGSSIDFQGISNDTGAVATAFARIYGLKTNNTQGNTQGFFQVATDNGSGLQTALTIDSSQRVGIGTTSPGNLLHLSTAGASYLQIQNTTAANSIYLGNSSGNGIIQVDGANSLNISTNGSERARIDSSGRLLVGTSSTSATCNALLQTGSGTGGTLTLAYGNTSPANGQDLGFISFNDSSHIYNNAIIRASRDGGTWTSGTSMPTRLTFWTTVDGTNAPLERMRIQANGNILFGTTTENPGIANTVVGSSVNPGYASFSRNDTALYVSRTASDGSMVSFQQGGTEEGSISVSGTTISYNGAHLSRWSQLPSGAERTEILRGSVLSNIDEMCEWGDEDNEQLNRMKVSDVEGDKNVSGVFQAWDDDDDTYTNDFYCAMTGDFIIRIAEGVTVERGDLLMSAGNGTAKPQGDGYVQDKTIAKVTSTNVSCTYDDGSYCVPCVLMAC